MDEFLDEMDDEQVDDLLQPEEGEDKAPQLYEHFRFVADRGHSVLRVTGYSRLPMPVVSWQTANR